MLTPVDNTPVSPEELEKFLAMLPKKSTQAGRSFSAAMLSGPEKTPEDEKRSRRNQLKYFPKKGEEAAIALGAARVHAVTLATHGMGSSREACDDVAIRHMAEHGSVYPKPSLEVYQKAAAVARNMYEQRAPSRDKVGNPNQGAQPTGLNPQNG